jgi:hypothetical protein
MGMQGQCLDNIRRMPIASPRWITIREEMTIASPPEVV